MCNHPNLPCASICSTRPRFGCSPSIPLRISPSQHVSSTHLEAASSGKNSFCFENHGDPRSWTRWWYHFFTPNVWGNAPIWCACRIFFKGWVAQPPTSEIWWLQFMALDKSQDPILPLWLNGDWEDDVLIEFFFRNLVVAMWSMASIELFSKHIFKHHVLNSLKNFQRVVTIIYHTCSAAACWSCSNCSALNAPAEGRENWPMADGKASLAQKLQPQD